MYLQSLEMLGFKSFATRTVLHFHRGVTAVVGPNGCGKSNVLDAIRWVLGEQSAKALRGGEMADVIFSGTDSRPALGMAEVSLTFADCEKELGVEWNEVRITRRVYRDGKSEYFLNKAPCRLRDIQELFMDTGVGRSAYSIMEQGKIDLILSSRPEDRRAIFEEAAGVTKYKAQKKEALRKLEYTEANLLRVQDIIKEVRRQIGSLQRQAAKARRYKALLADLRTLDAHLSRKIYDDLGAELRDLRGKISGLDEARAIHERETAEQENELAGFRARIAAKEQEMAAAREEVQELRNRIFSAENRLATNSERIEEARALVLRHQSDIAAAREKIRIQEGEIEETERQIAAMLEILREKEAELAAREARLAEARSARAGAEREIAGIAAQLSQTESHLATLRTRLSAAAGRREAGETRLRLLQAEQDAAQAAAADLDTRLQALAANLEACRENITGAAQSHTAAQHACEAAQKKRQEAEYALNLASKDAASLESRLEVLRQLQEQGEGLGEGAQAVIRGLDNPAHFQPSILGVLGDRIRVPAEFLPAIEAALGASQQAVLLANETILRDAITVLGRDRLGRAILAPVSEPPEEIPSSPGGAPEGSLGWAADKISGSPEALALAAKLLRNVALAADFDTALALRAARPELSVATLAGEYLDAAGWVAGGRSGEAQPQSALARRVKIDALECDLQTAIARLDECHRARAAALAEVETTQEALITAREALQAAQVALASCENEEKLLQRQKNEVAARLSHLARESAQITQTLAATRDEIASLENELAARQETLEHLRLRRTEAETALHEHRQREESASEALQEVRVAVATGRQQQQHLAGRRAPMNARLAELCELTAARERETGELTARIQAIEEENTRLSSGLESLAAARQTAEARSSALSAEREDLRGQAEALETALREARIHLTRIQDEKNTLELRAAQLDMRRENTRNHVSQRYHLDLEAFEPDTYALLLAIRERSRKLPAAAESPSETSPEPAAEPAAEGPSDTTETPDAPAAPEEPAANPAEAPVNWDLVEALVADLTERLESMGPVNLEAIQEFEELEQRQIFLEKQNADLVNSKAELLEVIAKINRTTRELFADTFAKIRDNFRLMFAELFGGGHANLELLDESDPLESGIEIVARPPGKQLKSVSLLSGGERTMTAVSLLFAIYMVKPSPFCVLDEMDAPLDESNINRFIKILDRFLEQSQFVVITHNKRTIARADMLYGVTMEEHGVSKLVSVRFSGQPAPAAQESPAPAPAG